MTWTWDLFLFLLNFFRNQPNVESWGLLTLNLGLKYSINAKIFMEDFYSFLWFCDYRMCGFPCSQPPSLVCSMRSIPRYAYVEFDDEQAVPMAERLDGSSLRGRPITVCFHFCCMIQGLKVVSVQK